MRSLKFFTFSISMGIMATLGNLSDETIFLAIIWGALYCIYEDMDANGKSGAGGEE